MSIPWDIMRSPGDLSGVLEEPWRSPAPVQAQWDVALGKQGLVGGTGRWRPFFWWHLGDATLCIPSEGDVHQAGAGMGICGEVHQAKMEMSGVACGAVGAVSSWGSG